MSSIPASAMISASPSFWQVMPLAPALTCICASSGLLWVLMCGRLATPAASQAAWIRAMLASTRSMSMTAQGVPYSRAILEASGVVINSAPVVYPVIASQRVGAKRRPMINSAKQSISRYKERMDCFVASAPRNDVEKACCVLCLFNLFAKHFKLQPLILGLRQFLLRFGQRVRGGVEFLAVLLVEIGIIKNSLLLCNIRLQFRDRLRQRVQRVFFIEVQPALRATRRRSSP